MVYLIDVIENRPVQAQYAINALSLNDALKWLRAPHPMVVTGHELKDDLATIERVVAVTEYAPERLLGSSIQITTV